MESIISTFHIDWKIIIAQAINFGVVFTVLYIFALKPLGKLMAERAEKIAKGVEDAKESSNLFQKATEEYKQNIIKLRQVNMDAKRELDKELEQLRIEHLKTIQADNDEWVKKRKEQLAIDKKYLVEEATKEVVAITMLATEKLISSKKDLSTLQ